MRLETNVLIKSANPYPIFLTHKERPTLMKAKVNSEK